MQKWKRKNLERFVAVCLFLLVSLPGFAQYRSWWYGGANVGLSLFYGDVTQKNANVDTLKSTNVSYGFVAGRNFNNIIGLEFSFVKGDLSGVNKNSGEYFKTDYFETVFNGTLNLLNLFTSYKQPDRYAAPYLKLGVGYSQYNSSLYDLADGRLIHSYGFGNGGGFGGRSLEGVYIFGFGINGKITANLFWNFDFAYHAVFADALDAKISGEHDDAYAYASVGISWRFGFKGVQASVTKNKAVKVKNKKATSYKVRKYKAVSAKKVRKEARRCRKKVKKDKYNKYRGNWN
jgi:hypothetical protein